MRARASANASQLTRSDQSLRFASTTERARADSRSSNGATYDSRFEDVDTFVVFGTRARPSVIASPRLEIVVDATKAGPKVTTFEFFCRADSRSSEVSRVPMK